jgi:hypothetical protein
MARTLLNIYSLPKEISKDEIKKNGLFASLYKHKVKYKIKIIDGTFTIIYGDKNELA